MAMDRRSSLVAPLVAGGAAVAVVWAVVERWRRVRKARMVSGRQARVCVVLGSQWGDEGA